MSIKIADDAAVLERETAEPHASGFADALRQATQVVHRQAERAGIIADLLRGRATRDGYVVYLRNLFPVYHSLEQSLTLREGAMFAPYGDGALRRCAALTSDLRVLAGSDWLETVPLLPSASDYALAIEDAALDDRLAAHAYARYLGDLSGGQILAPLLARTLALPPEALSFYDFTAVPSVDARKAAIRQALDTVDPAGPTATAIIAEAISAFRHNIALAEAVAEMSC